MRNNISDKSVQASVQRAIDNNQLFSLKHISQLKDLIRLNITVMVDPKISQNYSCMSLIQYAIKENKPEPLQYMLDVAVESGMSKESIQRSDFKYENNNLLFLAVDFNSISCLKVLIDFFRKQDQNFSVDISDPFGESPLSRAIKLGNEEAIKLLLENNASLLYFDQTKNKLSTFMPLLSVFFFYHDIRKLKHILDEVIQPCLEKQEKGKFMKIMTEFYETHFTDNFLKVDKDGTKILKLFTDKRLIEACSYLNDLIPAETPSPIPIIDNSTGKTNKDTQETETNTHITEEGEVDDPMKCHFCKKSVTSENSEFSVKYKFSYCIDCQDKYEKYCKEHP